MLGERILDPGHVESGKSSCEGLGFLPTVTVFRDEKTTAQVKAVHLESRLEIEGYEIHMGCTQGRNGHNPLFKVMERHGMETEDYDGMVSSSDNGPLTMGTYIHGLFDGAPFRRYFLDKIRAVAGLAPMGYGGRARANGTVNRYDHLAKIIEDNIDMKLLNRILDI